MINVENNALCNLLYCIIIANAGKFYTRGSGYLLVQKHTSGFTQYWLRIESPNPITKHRKIGISSMQDRACNIEKHDHKKNAKNYVAQLTKFDLCPHGNNISIFSMINK